MYISIILLSTLGVRSANGYDWKMKLRIWSQPSNYIICLLLIKCICFMYRSLNLVKNIPTTCATTRYVTIKIEQILKFSDIFICFLIYLFLYFSSSIEKTPPFIFLFLCFLLLSFYTDHNGNHFFFISLFLFLCFYTYCCGQFIIFSNI